MTRHSSWLDAPLNRLVLEILCSSGILIVILTLGYLEVSRDSPSVQNAILQSFNQWVLTGTVTVAVATLVGLFVIAIALIETQRPSPGGPPLRFTQAPTVIRPMTKLVGIVAALSIVLAVVFQVILSINVEVPSSSTVIQAFIADGILLIGIIVQIVTLLAMLRVLLDASAARDS